MDVDDTTARSLPTDLPDQPAGPQDDIGEVVDRESLEERVAHLVLALEHRTVIGQATGIVMERYRLSADAAFATLLRVSSTKERKVYDLAQELVQTGKLEGL